MMSDLLKFTAIYILSQSCFQVYSNLLNELFVALNQLLN